MKAEDQFHLGIVAEDFEATMAVLSSLFRYEWGEEVGGPIPVALPTGEAVLELRCAYSVTTPRLEIIRSIPGTLWEPATGTGIHHIGYWSDDVAADSAELVRHGYVTEATRTGPDGTPFFTFHRSANGFRVELVSRAAQPGLQRCWAVPKSAVPKGAVPKRAA
ncbi:VOC family protein [Streptomyces himalayensis]|uniref:VOC family protein n=1 Tax=Streptomyces himalayensis subsp. himalayensis TaxID=2756131 RepID=A0A7W0DMI9_9ACTN|nr:VOC family protein [Streptomyces himalayensis]MBA2947806.1 VOC family protein [Streptomyces himalayensis subsp. himalayensis]